LNKLVIRAKHGDKSAENEIFEHLSVRFRAFTKQVIRGEQDAEDIAQDACAIILKKYKTESFSSSFPAWAHGVLRMTIGNFLQKNKTEKKLIVSEYENKCTFESLEQPVDFDLRRRLNNCASQIIGSYRRYARVLNLIHQGYRVKEICDRMSISSPNLYVILNRGRSILKECLEKGRNE
jgi:RNA polymerase sigma factor (sigma-70 family)